MKNIILIVGALIFSTIFYKQSSGLNLLIFSVLTVFILSAFNIKRIKNTKTILIALAYITSGIAVFLYNTNLNTIVNIILFITLVGSFSEHKSSIYMKWLNGIYSSIVSVFARYFDNLNLEVKNVEKKDINYKYWLLNIGIPLIVLIIFINLYRNGNPLFDELISKIDFSFINFEWLLLAALGYYLFYNITNPIQIEPATVADINTGNELLKNSLKEISEEKIESERSLGTILIGLLNVLIVFFLTTDAYSLLNSQNIDAVSLSKQVHQGTNTLIISILLAISIIIYFFRGNMNFYQKNKQLKNLTYCWIILNSILVFFTAYKNIQYSTIYGFTYKRIGVFIYLSLTLIGLITTYIKVNKTQNYWYLVRKNSQVAFAILILSTTINWDKIITYYNISYAKNIDSNYLLSLSDNNTFLLKHYAENNNIDKNLKETINERHTSYIKKLEEKNWQELTYDNLKISKND